MKYWNEMQTKYGFSDGEAEPAGVESYRTAYILAVNSLAAAHGSRCRVRAYNRPGMHNCWLILTVPADAVGEHPELGDEYPDDIVITIDDGLQAAIDEARLLDVDSFVYGRGVRRKKLALAVSKLTGKKETA